jgi:hypothetical protein
MPVKANPLALLLLSLLLTGCQIRTAEPNAPQAKTNPAPDQADLTEPASKLDKSNAFITEVKVPMAELGPNLRKLGKFDAHLTWTDAFIKETLTAASLLKKNDRLEGPMLAKVGKHVAEVNIIIIRVDEDSFALRVIGSHKPITDELEKALKSK